MIVVPEPKLTPPPVEVRVRLPVKLRLLFTFNNPLAIKVTVLVDALVKSALTLIFPPLDEERM